MHSYECMAIVQHTPSRLSALQVAMETEVQSTCNTRAFSMWREVCSLITLFILFKVLLQGKLPSKQDVEER